VCVKSGAEQSAPFNYITKISFNLKQNTMEYKSENYILQVKYEQYVRTSTRREECHGYHYFTDVDVKNVIERITIDVNGCEIDITDRLTEIEKQQISENLD
jgi:hypothetical protein